MGPFEIYLQRDKYDWYSQGKTYELWPYNEKFSTDNIFKGRRLVIHRGRTGTSLTGEIGEVVVGSLDDVLEQVSFSSIAPTIDTVANFREEVNQLFRNISKYIAFEVILNQKQT